MDVVLRGHERVLRACITSFRTVEEGLDVLVNELERARTHAENPIEPPVPHENTRL